MLTIFDLKTFVSTITLLIIKIYVIENDNILFSYIRIVLEVFVLYSITTLDFT